MDTARFLSGGGLSYWRTNQSGGPRLRVVQSWWLMRAKFEKRAETGGCNSPPPFPLHAAVCDDSRNEHLWQSEARLASAGLG